MIAPTKSNLLKAKSDLKLTKEGHAILDHKREILLITLIEHIQKVKEIEEKLKKRLSQTFSTYKELLIRSGMVEATRASSKIRYDYKIKTVQKSILGRKMSTISIEVPDPKKQFSFQNTTDVNDRMMIESLELMKIISELAEIYNLIITIVIEFKKVQRRCNALDKILIPANQQLVKWINEALDERSREELFVQKLLKANDV